MKEAYKKRQDNLLKKYGSTEALREHYRQMQKKSLELKKERGTFYGGFNQPETQSKIAKAREAKRRLGKETREEGDVF